MEMPDISVSAPARMMANLSLLADASGALDRIEPIVIELPYEELYLYPGNSFSPLHQMIPIPSTQLSKTSSLIYNADSIVAPIPLAFHTLRKTQNGSWEVVLAILEADDGDERVLLMRADLYPGAILHLPSLIYTSTLLPLDSPIIPALLVQDLQSTRFPLLPSTAKSNPEDTQPQILRLAFRQKAHVQAAAVEKARKDGVLMGWTKKVWGIGVRGRDERARNWLGIMESHLHRATPSNMLSIA